MYIIVCVIIMAVVTYIPRVIPLTIFNKKINSIFIKSLLNYIPYAVLGAMTFPSIFYSTENMLYSTVGTLAAIVLAYFEKDLLIVAVSSVLVIYCLNIFV
ncbi:MULTISPECIES: AzlD domain-containing protein [Clostridium]|uniref:AzlD domain-containing protein n=1 Tax=Clostridium aquiflavi TaxID=3073603 RepID=A0ABU1EEV3_9CLOT|nr:MULTISPECIES: AzlD domain-containing protein [unclassified Clostridium]MDR5586703.1 AzlD domain-containing protein [Clostridium sp. 5N-1]NFG62129.1 AzlD domain-containing protein [Clostridium botulinum]NFQ09631.1 AzlD domain-containing protein [Clostridium botulinum]